MSQLSSPDLEEEARAGHDRLWKYIFRYAYQLIGDRSKAEDLTQETFVAYLRQQQRDAAPVENAGGWMRTVVRRLAYREYNRRAEIPEVSIEVVQRDGAWGFLEPIDPAPSAEQYVIEQSALKAGAYVLAQLAVKERRCLTLYFQGEDFAQIADKLHISRWTARRVTLRAIAQLQRQIGGKS